MYIGDYIPGATETEWVYVLIAIDPLATKYLKRWSGLTKPADPSRLSLPQTSGGLELSSISMLYQKIQMGKAVLLMTSRDAGVQHATKIKESQAQRKKFRPITITQKTFTSIPEASSRTLARAVKNEVQKQDVWKRLAHAATLHVQEKFLELSCDESARVWSRAIQSSSSAHLKFAINAAQDTLPHDANLSLWRKGGEVSDR